MLPELMAYAVQQRLPPSRFRSTGHLGARRADPTRDNRVTHIRPGAPLHFRGGAAVSTRPCEARAAAFAATTATGSSRIITTSVLLGAEERARGLAPPP